MTQRYSCDMQADKGGDWVEAKDYDQLESEFEQYKVWAEERIENLEYELGQVCHALDNCHGDSRP